MTLADPKPHPYDDDRGLGVCDLCLRGKEWPWHVGRDHYAIRGVDKMLTIDEAEAEVRRVGALTALLERYFMLVDGKHCDACRDLQQEVKAALWVGGESE